MTVEVTLDEFEGETSAGESSSLALEERLLTPSRRPSGFG